MSRSSNFLKGIASGYLAMFVNIVYTIGSVPLALHYLSKQEFGLWALAIQIGTYFSLIDAGMYGSTSRTIIDYKDNKSDCRYGSVVLTSALVFIVQGAIVALAGGLLSSLASGLLDVPAEYFGKFSILLMVQCLILAVGFSTRIFGILLYSHQKYEYINFFQILQLITLFIVMWGCFRSGIGLYSVIIASVVSCIVGSIGNMSACIQLGLLPKKGFWGRPNSKTFWILFSFGKDVFLVGLGNQLMNASQILLITRFLGLDAAATWAVCGKCYTLAQQFLGKIYDYSQGAFSEMLVRGERERLCLRFRDILILTASSAAFFCGSIGTANGAFVHLWTNGRVHWDLIADILMAVYIYIDVVIRCHGCLAVFTTKQVGFARYIYFIEGATFVIVAYFGGRAWGFAGVFAASIVAKIIFSCSYGLYRSRDFFNCSYRDLMVGWMAAPLRFLALFLVECSILWIASGFFPERYRFVFLVISLSVFGLPLLWRVGLTEGLQCEIFGFARRMGLPRFQQKTVFVAEPEKLSEKVQ